MLSNHAISSGNTYTHTSATAKRTRIETSITNIVIPSLP